MARKTPPFPNYEDWTTAKFFGFLRSGLREKFNRYPVKYAVLQAAAEVVPVLTDDGTPYRYKTGLKEGEIKYTRVYTCASCKQKFKQKEVAVDHIVPAGQLQSFDDMSGFASRLFCNAKGLQVLCHPCHDKKTKEDKDA